VKPLSWSNSLPENRASLRSEIDRLVERGAVGYVRCVLVRRDAASPWEPFFGRIDFAAAGSVSLPPPMDFGGDAQVRVLAETLSGAAIRDRVMAAVNGSDFICENVSFSYPALQGNWIAYWFGGREEAYADGWPGIFASARGHPTPQEPVGSFPSRGAGFFRSFDALLKKVSAFEPYHEWRDARRNQCNLFLWDERARIAAVEPTKDGISVRIEGPDVLSLQLHGTVRSARSETPIETPATSVVQVVVDGDPLVGDLCLLDGDLKTVDEMHWDKPMAAFIRAWEERRDGPAAPVTVVAPGGIVHNRITNTVTNSTIGANAVGHDVSAKGSVKTAGASVPNQAAYLAELKEVQRALLEQEDLLDQIDPRLYEALNQFLRTAKNIQVELQDLRGSQDKILEAFERAWTGQVPAEAKSGLASGGFQFVKELLKSPLTAEVARRLLEP